MRPALQLEHDLEGPKRGNEASAAAAALLGRTEHAGAAAEHDLEQLEARKWGQRCSGSNILNDQQPYALNIKC